jgi:hypothetical protein
MEQKLYHKASQAWADLSAGILSESGGCIQVGQGEAKPGGFMRVFDQGYPASEKFWSAAERNAVITFQATFPAGLVKGGGINRAHLLNGTARPFAQAHFCPALELAGEDTLRIIWEITIGWEEMNSFPKLREWVWELPDLPGAASWQFVSLP